MKMKIVENGKSLPFVQEISNPKKERTRGN